MRHFVPFSFRRVILFVTVIGLTGCATMKTAPRIEPESVRQVRVYDCRGGTEQFVTSIDTRDKVEQIVQLLGRYEKGWDLVQLTVPVGALRLDYVDSNDSGKTEWPETLTQFRITPRDILTIIDGKYYGQDISRADRQRLCQIIGLEESFFDETPIVTEAPGPEHEVASRDR